LIFIIIIIIILACLFTPHENYNSNKSQWEYDVIKPPRHI